MSGAPDYKEDQRSDMRVQLGLVDIRDYDAKPVGSGLGQTHRFDGHTWGRHLGCRRCAGATRLVTHCSRKSLKAAFQPGCLVQGQFSKAATQRTTKRGQIFPLPSNAKAAGHPGGFDSFFLVPIKAPLPRWSSRSFCGETWVFFRMACLTGRWTPSAVVICALRSYAIVK